MPSLRSLKGLAVRDLNGGVIGTVTHVLCHPEEPVVVGLEVQPANAVYVVSRKPRYVALEGVTIGADGLEAAENLKDWSGSRAEKKLGFEWEQTVIWVGMPLISESGAKLGYIRDASFSVPDARLTEILVTEGLTSDVAVGVRRIDGALVLRFDGSSVRAKDEAVEAQFSGGLAAKAGTGAAVTKVVVGEAGKKAAELGGQAVKAAARSKPAKSAWAVLRETGKAFREGMEDGDGD